MTAQPLSDAEYQQLTPIGKAAYWKEQYEEAKRRYEWAETEVGRLRGLLIHIQMTAERR